MPEGKARVITLDPELERMLADGMRQAEQGTQIIMEPGKIKALLANLKKAVEHFLKLGVTPIVITSPAIRRQFKSISEQVYPDLVVLSYNELEQSVEIFSDWVVRA